MIASSSLFTPINLQTVLSSLVLAGGLYLFLSGFRLLARQYQLLTTSASTIRGAALGLIEIHGKAAGPHIMPAPITGKPCFLYRTTAWRQRKDKRLEWEKVAEETRHVPFFIDDSTGQLLIEPFGADLDLHRDFREEYDQPFLLATTENIPPCVTSFLSRQGIASGSRLRVEEWAIKPDDVIFAAGTLAENPGVKVCPAEVDAVAPASVPREHESSSVRCGSSQIPPPDHAAAHPPAPQVIRLAASASASGSTQMGQQAKIAAALSRAGIANPAAWSSAPGPTTAFEESAPSTTLSVRSPLHLQELRVHEKHLDENQSHHDRPANYRPAEDRRLEDPPRDDHSSPAHFDLAPPFVLMKGADDPFVISFRSRKELVSALAGRCGTMIWGGAALTFFGLYMLGVGSSLP